MSRHTPARPDRSVRMSLGRARRYAGYGALLAARHPRAAYVGWVGEGNLGDAAMHEAFRLQLPGLRLVPMPNLGRNKALKLLLRKGVPAEAICLGGGTLIGNGAFRTTLKAMLDRTPVGSPVFMLGPGAEDPAFIGRRHRTDAKELRLWSKVLPRFEELSVRGPRSAEILGDLGFEAAVVGDPALALVDTVTVPDTEPGLVGLNVGVADDLWGNDNEAVVSTFVELGRRLRASGRPVTLVSTWTGDDAVARTVAGRIGGDVGVTRATAGVGAVIDAIGRCEVIVAEKLHAGVFAAIAGVPTVPVEYQPKVRDFQGSLGRADLCVRTDAIDVGDLEERVLDLAGSRDDHAAAIRSAVAGLVTIQARHAKVLRSGLGLTSEVLR